VLGGVVAGFIATRAGSPAADVVSHALLSRSGVLTALVMALVAGLLLFLTVRTPGVELGRVAFTPLDAAALGAVAVVVVGWARGSVDAQQLTTGGGTSAFLLLVPALIVFAASVLAARLLAPTLRALGRAGRQADLPGLARLARPQPRSRCGRGHISSRASVCAFAVAYRSTLLRGQHDEASYAVPASYVLSEDFAQLVPVLHGPAPPLSAQVLRLSGNVNPVRRCLRARVARPDRRGAPTSPRARSRTWVPRSHHGETRRSARPRCRRAGGSRCRRRRQATTSPCARSSVPARRLRERPARRDERPAHGRCVDGSRSSTHRLRRSSSTC
jgi:chromate transport protein ChrA